MDAGTAGESLGERASGGEPADTPFALLACAEEALTALSDADLDGLDDRDFANYARVLEGLRTRVDARLAEVARHVERRGHGHAQGLFSTTAWLRHHLNVPGVEARARGQLARMLTLLPAWSMAAQRGEVGADQLRLMARVAANPRVHDALAQAECDLLFDAIVCPYDEFERRLRSFVRAADTEGAARASERAHQQRWVSIRQLTDGSWKLAGRFGALAGADVADVIAHFEAAEFEADWSAARQRLGGRAEVTVADLGRTDVQRRADALSVIGNAAASGTGRRNVALNVLFDEHSAAAEVDGTPPDPGRYRSMVCRTSTGHELDPADAVPLLTWAHIRRVLLDGDGVPVDWGRRQRLFRGTTREMALLSADRCSYPGCSSQRPRIEVDHIVPHSARGPTTTTNAAPLCGRHNRYKHVSRLTPRRHANGEWTYHRPDGTVVPST